METAYLVVTLIAVAANGFSGIAALLRLDAILLGMAKASVPTSWLVFPIGTLKTAGALGLALGLAVRPVGIAAAAGLVLFFACAVHTHLLARDYSPQFGLAIGFLALNSIALAVAVA